MQTTINDYFYRHRLYLYKYQLSLKPCIPSTFLKIPFPDFSLVCYLGINEECIPEKNLPCTDKTKIACHISLLQKAVRRFNLQEGLKAFDWLWENHLTALLRRLNLIAVEDGFYNPEDNSLWIWMYMVHTKGYSFREGLKNEAREAFSRLVLHPLFSRKYETSQPRTPFTLTSLQTTPELLPLFLRYQYGGKHGDMMMIYDFVQSYRMRPKCHGLLLETPTSGLLFQACDFHIFPWLAPTKELREKIWKHRSGINFRYLSDGLGEGRLLDEYDRKTEELYKKNIQYA